MPYDVLLIALCRAATSMLAMGTCTLGMLPPYVMKV